MILRYGYGAALNILSSITDNYFALVIGRTLMIFYLGWNPFYPKRAKVRPLRKMRSALLLINHNINKK
jgi:hypothetical protein